MEALEVETSIAEGEQALQALLQFARERGGTLEAHEAEKGIFKRLLPIGLAAMQLYFAQRGTGDVGPAITRADGSLGTGAETARTGLLLALWQVRGGPDVLPRCRGTRIFPLDQQVNLPERCYSYFLQEWMTLFAVEHPFKESAGLLEQLFDLALVASVLMEVAQEAPADYEAFYAQRPMPREDAEGALLVVSVDGKGVPMMKAEAVKLKAKLGSGEKRQTKKEALVGVSDTVAPEPRTPEARAALLVEPEAARARRQRDDVTDDAPRAQQVRLARQPGADAAGGDGAHQGRRRAPRSPTPQPLGCPARWCPLPVAPGAQAPQALEARDVCPGHHARRGLPLERGRCPVREEPKPENAGCRPS